jgi:hypothetical protein
MAPDTSTQIQAAFLVPAHWRGFAVDLYWTQIAAGTGDMQLVPTRSEVVEGALLTAGDEAGRTLPYTMPGVQQQVVVSNIFPRLSNTALGINHVRISRFGSSGAVTGPTAAFLGMVLRRLL